MNKILAQEEIVTAFEAANHVLIEIGGNIRRIAKADFKTALGVPDVSTKADKDLAFNSRPDTETSYTLTTDDRGKCILINATAANTLIVPTGLAGLQCLVKQKGAGQTNFIAGSGFTLENIDGTFKSKGQKAVVSIFCETSTVGSIQGDLTV